MADADMECDLIDQMRVLMRSRGVLIFNVTEGNNGTYQCATNAAANALRPRFVLLVRVMVVVLVCRYVVLVDQEFYLQVALERRDGGVLDGAAGQRAAKEAIAAAAQGGARGDDAFDVV